MKQPYAVTEPFKKEGSTVSMTQPNFFCGMHRRKGWRKGPCRIFTKTVKMKQSHSAAGSACLGKVWIVLAGGEGRESVGTFFSWEGFPPFPIFPLRWNQSRLFSGAFAVVIKTAF